MFHELQDTHVESLKRHLSTWKKEGRNGEPMSEMTMFDEIVAAHYRIGAHLKTGIHFNNGNDVFNRQKANAIRIKRLLAEDEDGVKEELAAQLVNLLPSILAAMPASLRVSFLNEYLSPLGLEVKSMEVEETAEINATAHLVSITRETADVTLALANLADGATSEELKKADKELTEAEEVLHKAHMAVRAQLH